MRDKLTKANRHAVEPNTGLVSFGQKHAQVNWVPPKQTSHGGLPPFCPIIQAVNVRPLLHTPTIKTNTPFTQISQTPVNLSPSSQAR